MDYNEEENLLAFAGSLGIGYLYKLGHKREVEVVDIEMLQENTDQVLVKLHGHFKKITQIKFRPKTSSKLVLILTASDDFSVRLWDATSGCQLALFLDINNVNSEVV